MPLAAGLEPGAVALSVSRGLIAWIVAMAAIAIGLVLWYLPLLAACGVSIAIVWVGWLDVRLHALRVHPSSMVALRYEATGWTYQIKQGEWLGGKPLAGGLVHPWLTVVRFKDDSKTRKTRTLVLLPDAISTENFRRLRVQLVWQRSETQHNRDS